MHSSTGFSPFFLDKGRLPRLPLHLMMGTDVTNVLGDSYSQAAYTLYHRLQDAYLAANESIKSKQISSKKRYDAKINVQRFVEGEWAYVWKPAPRDCDHKKFYDHFRGPFRIVKKLTDHLYKIQIGENKFDTVHMELMKSASPPETLDEVKSDDNYDCGEDKSLIEPKFPNDRPPQGSIASSPPVVETNKKDWVVDNDDDDDDDLISVSPNDQRTGHRYPRRNREQRIPYQHRP